MLYAAFLSVAIPVIAFNRSHNSACVVTSLAPILATTMAVTHMREPNDARLAAEVPELDVVLGGHDHNYVCRWVSRGRFMNSDV